jgi:hypothetical protein
MDRAWMYDLARIDPVYLRTFVSFLKRQRGMQTGKTKMIYFVLVLTVKNKIVWPDSKVVQSHLKERFQEKLYSVDKTW